MGKVPKVHGLSGTVVFARQETDYCVLIGYWLIKYRKSKYFQILNSFLCKKRMYFRRVDIRWTMKNYRGIVAIKGSLINKRRWESYTDGMDFPPFIMIPFVLLPWIIWYECVHVAWADRKCYLQLQKDVVAKRSTCHAVGFSFPSGG